jgi:hypothetical protein
MRTADGGLAAILAVFSLAYAGCFVPRRGRIDHREGDERRNAQRQSESRQKLHFGPPCPGSQAHTIVSPKALIASFHEEPAWVLAGFWARKHRPAR